MADELTLTAQLQFNKGNLSIDRKVAGLKADVAGDAYSAQVQSIPTTAGGTAVTIAPAVGTAGYAFFRNTDDTNYVEIGVQDGSENFIAFAKLLAGQVALVPLATTTIYAMADTDAVLLEAIVVEA